MAQRPVVLSVNSRRMLRLRGLAYSLTLIWLAIATYHYLSYYHAFLSPVTQGILIYLAIIYSLYSLLFYTFASINKIKQSKALLTAAAVKKISVGIGRFLESGPRDYTHSLSQLTKDEKNALLFSLVKLLFIPMMLQFLVTSYDGFSNSLAGVHSAGNVFSIGGFNDLLFPLLFSLFFLIDTAFFSFGYIIESDFLKSKLRSVEPTVLGWSVALVCYPPFNGLLGNFLPWYANDYATFSTAKATFWLRLASLSFMAVYASASVALGPKASNLTNRGIVSWGPYRLVRHPAYISKNLAWWLVILPVISLAAVLSMAVWSSIYLMRAITEERHLSADPDYLAYCKRVKYRFIPGLF